MFENKEALEFLKIRKSVPLTQLTTPGPDEKQLVELLEIAARVPDHGRMEPWRFILYRGSAVLEAGEALAEIALKKNASMSDEELQRERNRINRAPIAIGVVSNVVDDSNIPEWEQFLSAGAAAMNLVTAATAMGFGANWVTGWYSDSAEGRRILGLAPHEKMAGIVHIGSYDRAIPDRPRPDVKALTSEYTGPYQKS